MPTAPRAGLFLSVYARFFSVALLLSSCTPEASVSPTRSAGDSPAFLGGSQPIDIQIDKQARLGRLPDGQRFVTMTIRAKCPTGHAQLEEPLTLTQRLAYGEGHFGMTCNGLVQTRTFRVFIQNEQQFRRGPARAGVQLLVENIVTGAPLAATDHEVVRIN
jgi:hypothetical protein